MDAETSRESPHGRIKRADHYLVVSPGGGTAAEVGLLYRNLAVFCIEQQVKCLLITPWGDDSVEEHAMRLGFKFALVASSDRIRVRYLNAERDLRMAGVDAKMFTTEEAATRWLHVVSAGRAPAPG